MKHRKISYPWLAAVVVLLAFQLFLQARAVRIARQNPTLGVQFAAPLTAEQLNAATAYQQSDANTQGVTASFWGSSSATVRTDLGHTADDTLCIGYAGTAADCLPADYVQGTAPGIFGRQCAVSTVLAWQLFGSTDILGQTVTLDRTDYTISGVFTSQTGTLLYPARSGFTHAELRGVSTDTPKAGATQWASAAGLPAPQAIDYGPQKVWLARTLCHLPAVLVGLCLLAAFLGFVHGFPHALRSIVYFGTAVLLALLLPYFYRACPAGSFPTDGATFRSGPAYCKRYKMQTPPAYKPGAFARFNSLRRRFRRLRSL